MNRVVPSASKTLHIAGYDVPAHSFSLIEMNTWKDILAKKGAKALHTELKHHHLPDLERINSDVENISLVGMANTIAALQENQTALSDKLKVCAIDELDKLLADIDVISTKLTALTDRYSAIIEHKRSIAKEYEVIVTEKVAQYLEVQRSCIIEFGFHIMKSRINIDETLESFVNNCYPDDVDALQKLIDEGNVYWDSLTT
jgi:hypothetical protein